MKYGVLKEWGSPVLSQSESSKSGREALLKSPRQYFHSRLKLMVCRGESARQTWIALHNKRKTNNSYMPLQVSTLKLIVLRYNRVNDR